MDYEIPGSMPGQNEIAGSKALFEKNLGKGPLRPVQEDTNP
jgi:hypothetical protein